MSERDECRGPDVGAGAPADPNPIAGEPADASGDGETDPAVDPVDSSSSDPSLPAAGDVVQAVADFVEDLVEDTTTPSTDDD